MADPGDEVEVACIQAATQCALAALSGDATDGTPGIDEDTRTEARTFLRQQWKALYDEEEEKPSADVIALRRQSYH